MARFLEISLGLPTAIFTTMLLISLGFWIISLLTGADGGADGGADADVDVEIDGGGDIDSTTGILASLGLHRIPLSLVVTIVSLAGWFISFILVSLLSETGSVGFAVAVLILVAGLFGGLLVASPVAHLMAPLFAVHPAVARSDLIGRECVVKTGRVDQTFGQAEVTDAEFGTHIVQVRCAETNDLKAGSRALLVDVNDDGLFVVMAEQLEF